MSAPSEDYGSTLKTETQHRRRLSLTVHDHGPLLLKCTELNVKMSMSTFQKVTLASCVVLCVALLLPKMLLSRGKKDAERPEGWFPLILPLLKQGHKNLLVRGEMYLHMLGIFKTLDECDGSCDNTVSPASCCYTFLPPGGALLIY